MRGRVEMRTGGPQTCIVRRSMAPFNVTSGAGRVLAMLRLLIMIPEREWRPGEGVGARGGLGVNHTEQAGATGAQRSEGGWVWRCWDVPTCIVSLSMAPFNVTSGAGRVFAIFR